MDLSSRRSAQYGRAAVASSQPLASAAGMEVLLRGGNAADAAVAVGAALAVTEPCSNGAGGDLFALLYHASSRRVTAVLGNGAAPAAMTPEILRGAGGSSPHVVTVPGCAAAWCDVVERFGGGVLSLADVLAPAVRMADEGFAVPPVTAAQWALSEGALQDACNGHVMLLPGPDGRRVCAPNPGQVFRNPALADTLRKLSAEGRDGFYKGRVSEEIVRVLRDLGGVMTMEDLVTHRTVITDPIQTTYRGYTVYEVGPPTHGAAALLALNILEGFDLASMADATTGSAETLHVMIEAMRLAYAEAAAHVADPSHAPDRTAELLDKKFAAQLRSKISTHSKCSVPEKGHLNLSGTVQFCTVDKDGNGVSMIQSNYQGFGTCHAPAGCGFTLQNRGLNFSTDASHPNCVAPLKKPYHTIIPGLLTHTSTSMLAGVFGVMGSFMQPQGHVQVVTNVVDFHADAQTALDRHRFRITGQFGAAEGEWADSVQLERGMREDVEKQLRDKGHDVHADVSSSRFGRGQLIVCTGDGIVCAGSDGRCDGTAIVMS